MCPLCGFSPLCNKCSLYWTGPLCITVHAHHTRHAHCASRAHYALQPIGKGRARCLLRANFALHVHWKGVRTVQDILAVCYMPTCPLCITVTVPLCVICPQCGMCPLYGTRPSCRTCTVCSPCCVCQLRGTYLRSGTF
jgi:hypothetical protein